MKKAFAVMLALVMILGVLAVCSKKEEAKTADTEGELVVYGSCEED